MTLPVGDAAQGESEPKANCLQDSHMEHNHSGLSDVRLVGALRGRPGGISN